MAKKAAEKARRAFKARKRAEETRLKALAKRISKALDGSSRSLAEAAGLKRSRR
jgi:hypothetical protein